MYSWNYIDFAFNTGYIKYDITYSFFYIFFRYVPKPILFTSFLTDVMYQIGQNVLMFKAKYRTKRKLQIFKNQIYGLERHKYFL